MKLILVYTLKCNATCKICCFHCGPKQNIKMDFDNAKDYIRQAADAKIIDEISITGGEALLYNKEVMELIALCHSNNLAVCLTTNVYWAYSIESAYQLLTELRDQGLTYLRISTDEFHSAYIPYQNIENLIIANQQINLSLSFHCVLTKRTEAELPLEKKYPEYAWNKGSCQPIGRAEEVIPWEEYIYNDYGGKCTLADVLTIMPDGSAYPCCSQGLDMNILSIGSAKEKTLEELIKAKVENDYLTVITNIGPKLLKQKGEENGYYLSRRRDDYVSMCDLCHEIGSDLSYLERMDNVIKETACRINYKKLFVPS